eukprot:Lankesteria_metandrocarpae@DN6205_c0_g1_i1.p1
MSICRYIYVFVAFTTRVAYGDRTSSDCIFYITGGVNALFSAAPGQTHDGCPIYTALNTRGETIDIYYYRRYVTNYYEWSVDTDTQPSGSSASGGRMGFAGMTSEAANSCCPLNGTPIYLWVNDVGHVQNSEVIRADTSDGGYPLGRIQNELRISYYDEETRLIADNVHQCANKQLQRDKRISAVTHVKSTLNCYSTKYIDPQLTADAAYSSIVFSEISVLYGKPNSSIAAIVPPLISTNNPVDCARQVVERFYGNSGTTASADAPDGYFFARTSGECYATFDTATPYNSKGPTESDLLEEVFGFVTPNMFEAEQPPTTSTVKPTTSTITTSTTPPMPGSTQNTIIIAASCVGAVGLIGGAYVMFRTLRSNRASAGTDDDGDYEDYGGDEYSGGHDVQFNHNEAYLGGKGYGNY